MTTIERTALCPVAYCPEPTNPWWHRCLRCEKPEIHHHHVEPRGMGGSESRKYNRAGVVPLCPKHHEEVTKHEWSDYIIELPIGRFYVIFDLHGKKLFERELGASTAEGDGNVRAGHSGESTIPSAAGASGRGGIAESGPNHEDYLPPTTGQPAVLSRAGTPPGEGEPLSPPPPFHFTPNGIEWDEEYTFADWREASDRVMRESQGRQWRVGDLVNAERWAECSQYFEDIAYPVETQANYGRIAQAYKLAERRSLSFGHHSAVYKHPDRLSLLDAALKNGWTKAELRQAAYPSTPRPKRWTLENLWQKLKEWPVEYEHERDAGGAFLRWLEVSGSQKLDSDG